MPHAAGAAALAVASEAAPGAREAVAGEHQEVLERLVAAPAGPGRAQARPGAAARRRRPAAARELVVAAERRYAHAGHERRRGLGADAGHGQQARARGDALREVPERRCGILRVYGRAGGGTCPWPASSRGPAGRPPPCPRPAPWPRRARRCRASGRRRPARPPRPSRGPGRFRPPRSRPRRRTAPRPWPSRRRPGATPCRRLSRGRRVPSPPCGILPAVGRPGRHAGPAPTLRGRGDIARHVSISRPPRALRRRWQHPPPGLRKGQGRGAIRRRLADNPAGSTESYREPMAGQCEL